MYSNALFVRVECPADYSKYTQTTIAIDSRLPRLDVLTQEHFAIIMYAYALYLYILL